jgi:hypothetical protein
VYHAEITHSQFKGIYQIEKQVSGKTPFSVKQCHIDHSLSIYSQGNAGGFVK